MLSTLADSKGLSEFITKEELIMYEPIIDPMIFYWIDILEKAGRLPAFTLLGGFLGGVFIFIVCTLRDCTDKQLGKYLGTWELLL